LSEIEDEQLSELLMQRLNQHVFYLTVEHIEEIDYDGWVYDFEVPEHGNYIAGGMLAHNTSALLSFYINDIEDPNAAPIVIDPKSELSRICLDWTPLDCGKRVWFLDLGHPAFGMSPLRLIGDRPLAIEAAQIAENVVAALLDINENQIYQSSRRYLYHAVIGAIAIAHRQSRRAKLEDVYTLLRPARDEFRAEVAEACADQADLDQTAEFFRSVSLAWRPPGADENSPMRLKPEKLVRPLFSTQSCPTTCAWPPAASRNGSTRRATRSPGSPASRPCAGSSTTPPTSRCARSSRRATS
jgi:hypothetical protein